LGNFLEVVRQITKETMNKYHHYETNFSTFTHFQPYLFYCSCSTETFNYTGAVQTYTVPSCVTSIDVVVAGAKGGGFNGGNGATVTATLEVIPGQVLEIYVGGQGGCPAAGFNGGGLGTTATGPGNEGCGGGGASDIRVAPYALANRVIVGAGGGGMGGGDTDALGGTGGCDSGTTGTSPFGQGGGGATQFSGGTGGPPWIASGNTGAPGTLGFGGNGATDPCYDLGPGGGGGGGYYGGGGGGSDCFGTPALGGGGGGGGSSFTPAGGNCVSGNSNGNGFVSITPSQGGMNLVIEPTAPSFCEGESVTINISGGVNYVWSPANGLSTTEGPTVVANPTSTQTYQIIADDGEECIDTVFVTVTVVPYPEVLINPSSPAICDGESVQIAASGATTYVWSPAAGLNSTTGSTVTASPTSTQTYSVTGTTMGCSSDTMVTVTVNELPEITTSPANPIICPGESVELTALGGIGYIWSPPVGLNTVIGPTVTASPVVTQSYTVTGTDALGCSNTAEVLVTVSDLPDADAGIDQQICAGSIAQLIGTSAVGIDYSWSPNTGLNNSNIQNPVASPNQTTTYTLTVTDANGCTNTDEVTVTVFSVIADFTADPETGLAPLEITFTNNSSSNAQLFTWDYGDETTEITTAFVTQHFYESNGTYTVTLTVTDINGCSDTYSVNIVLQEPFSLFIPNIFTPNGDGTNDIFQPEVRGVTAFEVDIFDRWGTIVHNYSGANGRWDGTKNGIRCSDGVYFYVINLTTTERENQSHKGTITLLR
jgi:gliding motility-associated-like protein